MAFARGPVTKLLILSGIGKITVLDEGGLEELFHLFVDSDGVVSDRVLQSMWVSLCRESLLTGKVVEVATTGANSALVTSVELQA